MQSKSPSLGSWIRWNTSLINLAQRTVMIRLHVPVPYSLQLREGRSIFCPSFLFRHRPRGGGVRPGWVPVLGSCWQMSTHTSSDRMRDLSARGIHGRTGCPILERAGTPAGCRSRTQAVNASGTFLPAPVSASFCASALLSPRRRAFPAQWKTWPLFSHRRASSSIHFKPCFSPTAYMCFLGQVLYDSLISPNDFWLCSRCHKMSWISFVGNRIPGSLSYWGQLSIAA